MMNSAPFSKAKYPPEIKLKAAAALALRTRRASAGGGVPEAWQPWLAALFPSYTKAPFAQRHIDAWEWAWGMQEGTRIQPFVGIWDRGGGKSMTAELIVVALGARKIRRYCLYVCHEKGTQVYTPELRRWHAVEEHPTAQERRCDGYAVRLFGVPSAEVVTPEHRYWAKTIQRSDRGHGRPPVHVVSTAGWVEADDLTMNTWIGYPIDSDVQGFEPIKYWDNIHQMYIDRIPQEFHDPEFWWLAGLWWGDGTLGGERMAQIGITIANTDMHVRARVIAFCEKYGKHWAEVASEGCSNIRFADSALARWFLTWKQGDCRKVPPVWVERLSPEYQIPLVQGYIEADGNVDRRSVRVASIHLDGLFALRRILMRLGIAGTISQFLSAGVRVFPGNRECQIQDGYRLQFSRGAERLGYSIPDYKDKYAHPAAYVEDDYLWSRVQSIELAEDRVFIPIQTATESYLTHFGLSHNCMTQEQADDHVATIGALLESDAFGSAYPEMTQRMMGKFGSSKGWRRNRLRTAGGFTVDALGLDTASRGIKIEDQRPDLIIIDDIDSEDDSTETTAKKLARLTRKVLPVGTDTTAHMAIQNLVHPDSVFAQLADGRADMLNDRILSGPHPALLDAVYDEARGRIVSGTPTWEGRPLAACQQFVTTWGLDAFRAECQHEAIALSGRFLPSMGLWDACKVEMPALDKHTKCVLGMDAGESSDTFATVLISAHPTVPSGVAARYARAYVPGGDVLDFDEIEIDVRELGQNHAIQELAYDPFMLGQFIRRLQRPARLARKATPTLFVDYPAFPAPCVPFPQGQARLESDKGLYDLIAERRFGHDGNAQLREHMDNANVKKSADGRQWRIVKRRHSQKIDLAVATGQAAARMAALLRLRRKVSGHI